ncbi:MAG: tRNA (adenosine(37)-N6)-threonylcarbamoyltransferase complex dimerization subunit type 1 TsaB [Patescibacteria group bacterium]|mgnify:CR=1 FL=1
MVKIISIDTSDNKKINVGLEINGVKYNLSSKSLIAKSEAVLPLIDKLLKDNNLKIEEIDEVKVNTGPGSYTGLRVGATIANTLGFVLKIPINKKRIGELAVPVYNK